MVAFSASAPAIDALHGAVRTLIPVSTQLTATWKKKRTARRSVILETLKQSFKVGKCDSHWILDFNWLFDLRDATVPVDEDFRDQVEHPAGTMTAPENLEDSVESAGRAVTLPLEILTICQEHPKPRSAELVSCSQTTMKASVKQLAALLHHPDR